mmetsp:Transcript_703/g.1454  ORF Transcript_703/g.1454 Transcript_703/m.1454 type:complete len:412 (+) Transcript_703:141-1376(+)
MGAVLTAPLGAIGSCAGSCAGTFCAAGCCRLAFSGEVTSGQAVRCVLIWLQCFTVATAILTAATAERWLPWVCSNLAEISVHGGICECAGDVDSSGCWKDQSIYRAQAGGTLVYLLLLLLYVSGCKDGASRSYSIGKFMAVAVLWLVGLLLPNYIYTSYGSFVTVAAAVFLVVQSVLLIDFAYTWNEVWHTKAEDARRRDIFGHGYRNWIIAILVASALLLVGAGATTGLLLKLYVSGRAMVISAMVLAMVCLVVSITEWCEHGNLLASCVVALYIAWLLSETFAVMPNTMIALFPSWVGLLICSLSLVVLMQGISFDPSASSRPAAAPLSSASIESGSAAASEGTGGDTDRWGFALHCCVHVAATMYIAAALAPSRGTASFISHAVAVFMCLILYAWSLVAPKVLTNRQF